MRCFRCGHCRAVVIAGLIFLIGLVAQPWSSVSGQETTTRQPKKRLLILKNGRIVEGRISESAGGYVVDKSKGSMLVPFEYARFIANDRKDAYHKLSQEFPSPSATTHIGLARWCITQQLYEEAHTELRAALEMEPGRKDARSMLVRLQGIINPVKSAQPSPTKPETTTPGGFHPPTTESLAGLSRESAALFVRKVQPILMNRCGLASCHGPMAKNEYRLKRVRVGLGSHRIFAEQNLAETVRFIEPTQPEQSVLLRAVNGPHGHSRRAIFSGSRASDQIDLLRNWIFKVADERKNARGLKRAKSPFALKTVGEEPVSEELIIGRGVKSSGENHSSKRNHSKSADKKEDLLEKILRETRKDAFDPDEFNRGADSKRDDAQ